VLNGTAWIRSTAYRCGMQCDYCGKLATSRIPAIAAQVCDSHAIAFWTGLLAYAKGELLAAAINSAVVAGENPTVGSTVWLPAESVAPGR
jgi:hypothetical protein